MVCHLEANALRFEAVERVGDDLDRSLNDELSSVKLGLSLLNLEKGLGNLSRVCNFHDFHCNDLNATKLDAILDELAHAGTDKLAVSDEARLLNRLEGESGANTSQHLQSLVLNVKKRIGNGVRVSDGVVDPKVHDGRDR